MNLSANAKIIISMSAFGNGGFYTFTPEQHSEAYAFMSFR